MTSRHDPSKDIFHVAVGRTIAREREASGLTPTELAQRINCTLSSLQKAEDGLCCSLWMIAKIAHELDITLDALVPVDALR